MKTTQTARVEGRDIVNAACRWTLLEAPHRGANPTRSLDGDVWYQAKSLCVMHGKPRTGKIVTCRIPSDVALAWFMANPQE